MDDSECWWGRWWNDDDTDGSWRDIKWKPFSWCMVVEVLIWRDEGSTCSWWNDASIDEKRALRSQSIQSKDPFNSQSMLRRESAVICHGLSKKLQKSHALHLSLLYIYIYFLSPHVPDTIQAKDGGKETLKWRDFHGHVQTNSSQCNHGYLDAYQPRSLSLVGSLRSSFAFLLFGVSWFPTARWYWTSKVDGCVHSRSPRIPRPDSRSSRRPADEFIVSVLLFIAVQVSTDEQDLSSAMQDDDLQLQVNHKHFTANINGVV